MKISVVTPNLNGMPYLPRCVASIRDQAGGGLTVEHWIADGGSSDGSVDWLQGQTAHSPGYTLQWFQGEDAGMYDAIDKGWRRASGDVLAWLNSDEQYLPGALAAVAGVMDRRTTADFIYGDALVLHPDGSLAAFRKAAPLRRLYLRAAHLYIHSSSLFVRRRWIVDAGIRPDPSWRAAGDHEWLLRLLAGGARGRRLPCYLSAFFLTGANLGVSDVARRELCRLQAREPVWFRGLAPLWFALRSVEKWVCGGFRQSLPLTYCIVGEDGRRMTLQAQTADWRWVTR